MDRYKQAELSEAINKAGIRAPVIWRGMGYRDGGEDCERFRRAVFDGKVRSRPSLLLRSAFADCVTLRDLANNLKLAKARSLGRIDAAAATVLAVAEGARRSARPTHKGRMLRETVNSVAAGGPAPMQDWKASDMTPDLEKSLAVDTLREARNSIAMAFGVLPALLSPATTGPLVREAERHLANWHLAPIADLIAGEASEKLGAPVTVDVMRRQQAYDAGARARAVATVIQALKDAKEGGIDPNLAFKLVDWGQESCLI